MLESRGFRAGVEQRASLHQLLGDRGIVQSPERIKTLICPIFASNDDQQTEFYQVFDDLFPALAAGEKIGKAGSVLLPSRPRNRAHTWLTIAANVILFLLLGYAGWRAARSVPSSPRASNSSANATKDVAPQRHFSDGQDHAPRRKAALPSVWSTVPMVVIRLAPFLLFLTLAAFEFASWLRRQAILSRKRSWLPPSSWPVSSGTREVGFFKGSRLAAIARRMRTRQTVESRELDIAGTVAATIRSLGFVQFALRPATKLPDYLFLIDRRSAGDHLAMLFLELVNSLGKEGINQTAYFYDRNPQVCNAVRGGQIVFVDDLKSRFFSHRLVVFGSERELSNPDEPDTQRTLLALDSFPYRVLLSPDPYDFRGSRKVQNDVMPLLPATLDGLQLLSSLWQERAQAFPAIASLGWSTEPVWNDLRPSEGLEMYVKDLRGHLGPELFRWLCVCSFHSHLNWDLTLLLGDRLVPRSVADDYSSVLRLFRLRWFREGAMPAILSDLLVRLVDRPTEKQARAITVEYLEEDSAPQGTYAELVQKCAIAGHRWGLRPLEMQGILQNRDQARLFSEIAAPQFSLVIPRQLRRWFFSRSIPGLGLRPAFRAALAVSSAFLVVWGLWKWGPVPPPSEWAQYARAIREPALFAMNCDSGGVYPGHAPRFPTASGYFESGLAYFSDNNYECALKAFSNVIALTQANSEAFSKRAACLINLDRVYGKDGDLAIADLSTAIRLDPRNPRAFHNLSLIYEKRGEFEKALGFVRRAIEIDPTSASTHNEIGLVYEGLDRLDEAVAEFDKAIRLDPSMGHPHVNKGGLWEKKGRTALAVQEYQRALEVDPYLAVANLDLGRIFEGQGKYDAALREYTTAIDRSPTYRLAYKHRIWLWEKMGEYAKAISDADKLISFAADADAYLSRGVGYSRSGDTSRAIADFSKAIDLYPQYELALFDRAVSNETVGHVSEAIADFKSVLSLSPPEDHRKLAEDALARHNQDR